MLININSVAIFNRCQMFIIKYQCTFIAKLTTEVIPTILVSQKFSNGQNTLFL